MSWITKSENVVENVELEGGVFGIDESGAYAVKITQAYLQESKAADSQSVSLVIGIETEDGKKGIAYKTILGRDGQTFFVMNKNGNSEKREHFGLSISNTMFEIVLGKSIFDVEPVSMDVEKWNFDKKEMETVKVDGFPELIGKEIGVCWRITREIDGVNSKERGDIEHFFDKDSGLFYDEEDSTSRKIDRWQNMVSKKPIIIKEVAQQTKSSFGQKKETADGETPVKKWGR